MKTVISQSSLSLEAAQYLAQKAIDKGRELGISMNAVVVDCSGNPLVSLRDPGAPLPAMDFARKKAYTAVCYGWPTEKWTGILDNRPVITAGLAQHDEVAMFGGGVPVEVEGEIVGAIGVAGGKVPDDINCAEYAINEFNKV